MRSVGKKSLSIILSLIMVFGVISIGGGTIKASATAYNPDAAIAYAKSHWNDGSGDCQAFVKACLKAGGVSISTSGVEAVKNALVNGGYGPLYKLNTYVTGTQYVGAKASDNVGKVSAGDVIFWYCAKHGFTHTVLVGSVDSSTIYYYAHNSAASNKPLTYCNCLNNCASSNLSLYCVHMASNTTETPSASTDKKQYSVGESVTFSFSAPSATSLHLYLYLDGSKYFEGEFISSNTYTRYLSSAGHYSYQIVAHYSSYDIESGWDDFDVVADSSNLIPQKPDLWTDKSVYPVNESFPIYCWSEKASYYYITIYKDEQVVTGSQFYTSTYTAVLSEPGSYKAVAQAVNDYGGSEYSECYFSIDSSVPQKPDLWTDKSVYPINESFPIYCWSEKASYYYITIYRDGQVVTGSQFYTSTYTAVLSEPGSYKAVAQAVNDYGGSNYSECYFSIYNSAPSLPVITTDKTTYTVNEEILVHFNIPPFSREAYFTVRNVSTGENIIGPGLLLDPAQNSYSFTANNIGNYSVEYQTANEFGSSECATYSVSVLNHVLTYTLAYDANGGKNPPANQTGNGSITLSNVKPTRDGYTFKKWNTKADGSGSSYNPGSEYILSANVTLYAIWEQNPVTPTTYTLSYNANGGKNSPASQTGNGNITLSSTKPTRDGYTFKSWNTKADGKGTSYNSGAKYNLTASATLYAIWQKNETPNNPDNPKPNKPDFSNFKIKNYNSTLSVDYKSTVIFHTTMEAPDGYEIVWSNNTKSSECKYIGVTDSEYKISAKMINKTTGKAEAETDEVTVKVNTGFFAKIIAFFRSLFGSLPTYEDFKKK